MAQALVVFCGYLFCTLARANLFIKLKMQHLTGCDNSRHSDFRTTDLLNILF